MRRFVSSKLLLLQKVISDDNAANNGGGFNARKLCGPKRSANVLKLIPWEVYPTLISWILRQKNHFLLIRKVVTGAILNLSADFRS